MKIETVLVNMGEHRLREVFLSETCVETLKALDPSAVEPDRLRRIVLEKVSQGTMLRDRVTRAALVTALTRGVMRKEVDPQEKKVDLRGL